MADPSGLNLDELFDGAFFENWPPGEAPKGLFPDGSFGSSLGSSNLLSGMDSGMGVSAVDNIAQGGGPMTSLPSMSSLNSGPSVSSVVGVGNGNSSGNGNSNGNNSNGEAILYNANYDPRNVPVMVPANPLPPEASSSNRPKRSTKAKVVEVSAIHVFIMGVFG